MGSRDLKVSKWHGRERDKVGPSLRTPTPHGSFPSDAGALRTAKCCSLFVAFVSLGLPNGGHFLMM